MFPTSSCTPSTFCGLVSPFRVSEFLGNKGYGNFRLEGAIFVPEGWHPLEPAKKWQSWGQSLPQNGSSGGGALLSAVLVEQIYTVQWLIHCILVYKFTPRSGISTSYPKMQSGGWRLAYRHSSRASSRPGSAVKQMLYMSLLLSECEAFGDMPPLHPKPPGCVHACVCMERERERETEGVWIKGYFFNFKAVTENS